MAKTGDREIFIEDALKRYERPLVAYASHLTGDIERAQDVVQEAFMRLCRQDMEKVRERVRPWLYTVCRNLALDILRKEARMRQMSDVYLETEPGSGPSPAVAIQEREQTGSLVVVLAALPPNQQEAIRLKFQQGLRYREIAEVMEISVSNVGYLVHRGINAMKSKLSPPSSGIREGGVA